MSFNLENEVGGKEALERLIAVFYDRLFEDPIVGFIFSPHKKDELVQSQIQWLTAHLGDRSGTYEGKNLRVAHQDLPITSGHFNRRHLILRELLEEHELADSVQEAWLKLDLGLFDMIVKLGEKKRGDHATNASRKINLLDD